MPVSTTYCPPNSIFNRRETNASINPRTMSNSCKNLNTWAVQPTIKSWDFQICLHHLVFTFFSKWHNCHGELAQGLLLLVWFVLFSSFRFLSLKMRKRYNLNYPQYLLRQWKQTWPPIIVLYRAKIRSINVGNVNCPILSWTDEYLLSLNEG